MGVDFPLSLSIEVLPSAATFTASCTSPWPGEVLWDNTSVLSVAVGGEASEASHAPSCSAPANSQKTMIVGGDREPDYIMQFNVLKPQSIKPDICTVSLDTYDSARGFGLGRHSGTASVSDSESSEREIFPFFDASASRSTEAALFFFPPLRGELLSSSSSSSS